MKFQKMQGGRICKTFKNDCVIRAISFAMDIPYAEAFQDLMELGMEIGAYPNCPKVYETYLSRKGWIKMKPPRNSRGKLIRFADWADAPKKAVVHVRRHLTCVDHGYVVDEWDCRRYCIGTYWAKG
mgnify:CR=1 FL=1|tara:strand:+ start:24738 stop:25115 length:378 start_codon:yes stop_codon:yes gene_type:complete